MVPETNQLSNYLNNLGIHITHAKKDFITLEELFVYPDIRIINDISTIQKPSWTPQEVLDKFKLVYFRGTEETGKTSLFKKLAQDSINTNEKVIILNGTDINNTNIVELVKKYTDKYNLNPIADFSQYTIFIDDFEKQKLKPQYLDNLLKVLSEDFKQVVLFIDKKSIIHEQNKYLKHGFYEVEIQPFGYKKRYELIKKWVLLESENDENLISDEAYNRIDIFSRQFDSIMKKNIMDSRPIYILSIMQTLENLSHTNGNYSLTSYGQCYHVLITAMLSKAKVGMQELDGVLNFLSYLAYYFYKLKIDSISDEEFSDVLAEYSKLYVPPSNLKDVLIKSGILVSPDKDSLKFSQKYLYYFSCAKHLSDNSKTLQADITYLCENIHNEQNANILIFLVHHLRGTDLLDEILQHATKLLSHVTTFDMSLNATLGYKQIIGDRLLKIALDNDKSPEEQRADLLERKDKMEEELGEFSPIEYSLNSNDINERTLDTSQEFELIQQATSALRSIDVLGQIAKNRHSSIQIQGLQHILSSSYDTGLRVLNFYLSIFNDKEDDLEELLLNVVLENNEDITESEAKELTKEMINNFIFGICFYMIQLISQSTAHSKLIHISSSMCATDGDNKPSAAYLLINLYSQLLVSHKLPKPSIKLIKKEHSNNILVMSLLKSIVANHAYLHNLDFQDKQWIQDFLEIPVANQIKSNTHTLLPMPE